MAQDGHASSTQRPTSGPTPSQFARVPRFSASAARRASFPPRSPSPAKIHQTTRPTILRQRDEVEDATTADEDDEMLDSGHLDLEPIVQPPFASHMPEPVKTASSTAFTPSSPKRRKVDVGDTSRTPRSTPGRFILPSTETSRATFTYTDEATPNRPAFLTASLPPPEPAEPLPDAFSPRRRGQKFVPGGLAAEVQSWVIEAAQSATQSKRGRDSSRDEDSMYVMKIEKVQGKEPILTRGLGSDSSPVNAVLVEGKVNERTKRVQVDDMVSIRLPRWEAQICDEHWIVGVDWRTEKS